MKLQIAPFMAVRVQAISKGNTAEWMRCHVPTSIVALGVIVVLHAAPAQAITTYTSNFEGVVGSEWSNTLTDTTPVGARTFLGQFGNDTISLTLAGLPSHSSLTIAFDLFVIRSMDGSATTVGGDGIPDGPDVWHLDVAGGLTLLSTTFSNNAVYPPLDRQAYPDTFPGGDHLARTGAAENDTLGYTFGYPFSTGVVVLPADSVYDLSFTFAHAGSTVTFNFSGSGMEPLFNESWGIDNVRVWTEETIPAPAAIVLSSIGMGGVGWLRRRGTI
jgi:hypothetical protein